MADEGISAGGVHVFVVPRIDAAAWAKLGSEARGGAAKLGDDLGDRIGKAISKQIAKSVREGLTQGGAGLGTQGTRIGNDVGGKFATALRARLDQALRNLPTPTIGASTTEAEQKVRDLRDSLDRLRNQTVGVDISDADALAELRRIEDGLRRLSRDGATAQVRVDAGAAAAELAAIRREVDRLDGRNAKIDVNTNAASAAGDMRLLVSAGLAIGPAIIPGAVAAAAAILFIGSAATSVAAGIGVGALAFHGIGDAVKALDTAQQQSAKSGSTLASQQKTLASGADQVRSAEAGLANARANAGDSARRAGQAVADAERSVTAAQLDAVRAQRSLNEAREKEIADRQDLAQQLRGNTLDREQAALDVAAARARLAQTGAEQDRINFDQAILRQQNLELAGKRLAAQQVENTKVGVNGSKQVTAAQQGVVDAQQKVAAAERGVTEARAQAASQARQSAAAIASASQAVVTAQRNIGAATVAAAATGGSALDALNQSMGNLPVSGQAFARFIFGLKGDLTDLQGVAADGILPGAQQGIQTVLPYFGSLRTTVGDVATEIGSLEVRAAKTFTSPFWRQFFGFIASQAVPNMELLYAAGINVAESGARIIQGFSPVQRTVGDGLLHLTERFLAFSRGLEQNRGFQDFVQYAQQEVPHVLQTIEALAQAGVHIAAGFAPVGSVVVQEFRLLAAVINALPVPVITALATAMVAYRTASLLTAGVQALVNSNFVAGTARLLGYNAAMVTTSATTTAFQAKTAAVSSFIGGPFLAALTIAGAAVAYFYSKNQEQKQKTDNLADGLASLGGEYQRTGHLSAETFATMAKGNPEVAGLTRAFREQGFSLDDLGRSYQGNLDLQKKFVDIANQRAAQAKKDRDDFIKSVNEKHFLPGLQTSDEDKKKIDDLVQKSKEADEAAKALGKSYGKAKEQADLYAQASGGLSDKQQAANAAFKDGVDVLKDADSSADAYKAAISGIGDVTDDAAAKAAYLATVSDQVAASHLNAAEKAGLYGDILAGIGSTAQTSGPVFDALAAAFGNIASSSLDAHNKASLLKQTLDQMYGAAISQTEAAENQVRTQDSLTTQLGKNALGFDLNSKSTQGNSEKALANRDAIIANRDALEAALLAAREKYTQDLANGVAETDARAAHDLTIKSILDGVPKTQRQTAAVKELVGEYGAIPDAKSTSVTTPGLNKAIQDLITAHAVQEGLDKGWDGGRIQQEANSLYNQVFRSKTFADQGLGGQGGGKLAAGGPVAGPGGPTDDLVPAMLSNDEHVLTAAEVQAAGGHQNIYTLRGIIKSGGLKGIIPGFASGGAVGKWPINIPTNTGAAAILANLWQQWAAAQAAAADTGSADPVVARTILGVARSLKADHKVQLSAFETALVESGMRNLRVATDHDSLGVFQQRPSQGWGTPDQILDVAHAAHSYLTRAIANEPRFAKGTAGQLAQSVQRSKYPDRYDKRAAEAEALLGSAASPESAGLGLSAAGTPGGSAAIKAFIRSTDPLPYVFGAAGPKAYDCSGLSSAIFGLATGRGGGHGQRYFTTFDFAGGAPYGLKPGPGGVLTLGVNPTTHMAGNYGGLGFEAASTKTGIKIGASARKPSTFQKQFHLAQGGEVSLDLLEKLGLDIGGDPGGMTVNGRKVDRKLFDSGGIVPQGLSLMDNRTRGPELAAVMNSDQLGRLGGEMPAPDVRVYIGNEEITSRVQVVVDRSLSQVARLVGSGVRD